MSKIKIRIASAISSETAQKIEQHGAHIRLAVNRRSNLNPLNKAVSANPNDSAIFKSKSTRDNGCADSTSMQIDREFKKTGFALEKLENLLTEK